jgi:cyclase
MLRPRIVPCLLVHNRGLVKTVRFQDPKYVGDPINAVRIFNEKDADELTVLDIDATVEQRDPDFKMIENLATECRMPLCYGGGVRTLDQAKRIINLGVEKVAIGAAAVSRPKLITAMARDIGSQSVVVVLDSRPETEGGERQVYTHNGKIATGLSVIAAARRAEELGAGEIVSSSIERDGTMQGYDLDLARRLRAAVHVPITMLGGAGSLSHVGELLAACGIVGAAAGSLFVFKGQRRAVLISYPSEEQKHALRP